jgi:hypothetical protein
MPAVDPNKPRVFLDADVLFAGAAAPSQHGASLVVLRMAEITLIQAITSKQVVGEAERNLAAKMPRALPIFQLLVDRCLHVTPDPTPDELRERVGLAHPKDIPILAAALREKCPWLVTLNLADYRPGHPGVAVLRPGDFLLRVRDLLTRLSDARG